MVTAPQREAGYAIGRFLYLFPGALHGMKRTLINLAAAAAPETGAPSGEPGETLLERIEHHGFHNDEKDDEAKKQEILSKLGPHPGTVEKAEVSLLIFFAKKWVEVAVDLLLFFLVLLPENYEFAHTIYSRVLYHGGKEKAYAQHTLAEHFDLWCPILEGVVCVIHTVIFVAESFFGVEVPHGLLIAIVASHLTCILIILHIEWVDRGRRNNSHTEIYCIEFLVVLLSVMTTVAFLKTEDTFRTFILICTVCTQFLCRSLTRVSHPSHDPFRRTLNQFEYRVLIGLGILLIMLLLEIFYLYFGEKHSGAEHGSRNDQ